MELYRGAPYEYSAAFGGLVFTPGACRRIPSTLLGVALLGYPDQLVEIEAIAAIRAHA